MPNKPASMASKLFAVLGLLLTVSLSLKGQITNTESFDGTTFVPTGWSDIYISGSTSNNWTRVTSGTSPTQSPHSGAGEAKYNSFSANGGVRALITPSFDLSNVGSNTATVKFWMYRDNGYSTTADKIDVYINTAANMTGATSLGTVNRSRSLSPTETANGWYQYSFNIPSTFNTTTNYLIFRATSAYGNNMYIDDIEWTSYPPVCSGTPSPGNTNASANPVCSGANFTLSLQTATTGSGVSYQWESSTNGTTYSNISGATSSTLTTSQTAATYYRCKVTCSGNTGTSTAIQVTMNSFYNCYCTLGSLNCTLDDMITNVTFGTINNSSSCSSNGYASYTSSVAAPSLARGTTNTLSVTAGPGGTENLYAWIDWNQNGSFETSEYISIGTATTSPSVPTVSTSVTIPSTATIGTTGMRVRVRWSSTLSSSDACYSSFTYGETEDYLVKIIPATPGGTNSSQCGSGTPTVSVSSGNSTASPVFKWYTTATGGTAISGQSGATLSNYSISTTTTFYVSELLSGEESPRKEVTATVNPVVSASITSSTNVTCFGGNNGTATAAGSGGSSYNYSWNTSPAQTTATATNLTAGSYTVTVTNSNGTCPATASVTITQPTQAASIPAISTHPSNTTVCSTATATFTAAATGLNITYQWQTDNGTSGATYSNISNGGMYSGATTTTLSIAGVTSSMHGYRYRLVASGTCSPAATSVYGILGVSFTIPSVSASASATTICAGTTVNFTATPTNGGTTPTYQWKVNGNNVGSNSTSFSSGTLANNDVVTVSMSSNATCAIPATVSSTGITMTVNPVLAPSVSIAHNAPSNNTICANTSVTYTATPVNGGTAPFYQWKLNGNNTGTNSSTFTTATLSNSDVVSVQMTTNYPCPTTPTVNSNPIQMTVIPISTPTISISTPTQSICAGTTVTFTAAISNGGSLPIRTWKRNGVQVGTNSNTYTTNSLNNGDIITCELQSSLPCPSAPVVVSNSITMSVTNFVTPFVVIATPQTTICDGTPVTFTATGFNGGNTPSYQWKVNGNNVGTNSSTYSSSTLTNGATVTVTMTTSVMCYTQLTDVSNVITMTVNPILVPSITTVASDDTICNGDLVNFTTSTLNPGTNPQYQWRRNGIDISGANNSTYSSASLNDGDKISVLLTSNAVCVSPANTLSNTITMKVYPLLTPSVQITADDPDSSVCTGTLVTFTASHVNGGMLPGYQWIVNGVDMVGAIANTFSMSNMSSGDVVSLRMTSKAICPVPAVVNSNKIKFKVEPTTPPSIFISVTPGSKIKPGDTVKFSSVVLNAGNAAKYQWYKNDSLIEGATAKTYTTASLQSNDVVELVVHSSLVCSDPDSSISNSVTMLFSTDVAELDRQFTNVKLYPNPNNGNFTLEAKFSSITNDAHAKIEVLNGVGQLVFKDEVEIFGGELKKDIRLMGVANGTYYIRLSSGDQSVVKPLNVQQ